MRHRRWSAVLALPACVAFVGCAVAAGDVLDLTLPWLRGRRAVASTGETLDVLREDGYAVSRREEGDLVSGPNGVFLVVTRAGGYTGRHLAIVMQSAFRLHAELGCFVTPVMCSRATRKRTFMQKGVLISGRAELADAIRSAHRL